MNFNELVEMRESCRAFTGAPVKREHLEMIVHAGRYSPSAKNTQPWKFYIVSGEKFDALAEAVQIMGMNKYCEKAGAFIVLVADKNAILDKALKMITSHDFVENDLGIAVASMTYQATDLGLGSLIVGGFNGKAVAEVIGLEKSRAKDVKLILAVGHKEVKEPRAKNRKDPRETVLFVD